MLCILQVGLVGKEVEEEEEEEGKRVEEKEGGVRAAMMVTKVIREAKVNNITPRTPNLHDNMTNMILAEIKIFST